MLGDELFKTIVVACVACGLKRTKRGVPRQGIPPLGATIYGPTFFTGDLHVTCIRCGVENFKLLEDGKVPDRPIPPVGWVKPPGG